MTYLNISVKPGDEYFISVAQTGIHSFMMLGVIPADNGKPKLLARIGKAIVALNCGYTDAAIFDEGVLRSKEDKTEIAYQAYTITAEQAHNCLKLIKAIEQEQLENKRVRARLEALTAEQKDCYGNRLKSRKSIYIEGYLPTGPVLDDVQEYDYQVFDTQSFALSKTTSADRKLVDTIIKNAQVTGCINTCRTTAVDIVEWVLQFKTNLSQFFFISPQHVTTLEYGVPNLQTFYVLPAPPNAYPDTNLSTKQRSVALKLYQQLENIPKQKLSDPLTRQKFNILKAAYLDIVGLNQLDVKVLLSKITEYEKTKGQVLFAKRSPCCISKFLGQFFVIPTTTKTVFEAIKQELKM